MSGYVICIKENGLPEKKLTRVLPYTNEDGGFALAVPYHKEKRGHLAKHRLQYEYREFHSPLSEWVEYSASDKVKLSIHLTGFVQFSSATNTKIVSGIDPATNQPRGLGLLGPPIPPNFRGPLCGLVAWGLDDFEDFTSSSGEKVLFTDPDLYFRRCTPGNHNGVFVEFFLLPVMSWSGVRRRDGNLMLDMVFPDFDAAFGVVSLRILPLPGQPFILGVTTSRIKVGFDSSSGFQLNSPSANGEALMASYPCAIDGRSSPSMDYRPASPSV